MKPTGSGGNGKFLSSLLSFFKSSSKVSKLKPDMGGVGQFKLKNPIKSVGMKLFLIFFLSVVCLVLLLGWTSYSKSKSIITDKISVTSEQTVLQTADKMDLIFKNFETMTLQLLQDQDLSQLLQQYKNPATSDFDRMQAFKNISAKLSPYINGGVGIVSAFIIPTNPSVKFISAGGTAGPANEDQTKEAWFKRVTEAGGKPVWLDTQPQGLFGTNNEPVFVVSRELKNLTTGAADYVLVFEIKQSMLKDALGQFSGGQIIMMKDDATIMSGAAREDIGKKFDIQLAADTIKAAEGKVGHEQSKYQGKQSLVVYKQMATSGWVVLAVAPISELVKETSQIFNATMLFAVVAIIVAVIVGLLVVVMIGRPLGSLRNLMQEGELGNLTVRSRINRRDEIGQLALSFNEMMEKITMLVRQTNESAGNVLETAGELQQASIKTATAAREIAVATEEIANGASSLAVEAEKGNSLTHEIGQQMQAVVSANEQMGVAASQVQLASEQGTRYMADLTSKTQETEDMTRSMVEKVESLKESTMSIRKILDVLNNLTKQTNILSLNATIEAARAGAAGKGFMVVADEIRRLAEQSKQSIEVVGSITETIQNEVAATVVALSNAYPVFREQIESVKEAETLFRQVQTNMGGFIGQLREVSGSIRELEQSQLVLTEAMTNVSAVSEESSATSEEVASLSNEQLSVSDGLVRLSGSLEELSNSLRDSLARFKI